MMYAIFLIKIHNHSFYTPDYNLSIMARLMFFMLLAAVAVSAAPMTRKIPSEWNRIT